MNMPKWKDLVALSDQYKNWMLVNLKVIAD